MRPRIEYLERHEQKVHVVDEAPKSDVIEVVPSLAGIRQCFSTQGAMSLLRRNLHHHLEGHSILGMPADAIHSGIAVHCLTKGRYDLAVPLDREGERDVLGVFPGKSAAQDVESATGDVIGGLPSL